MKRSQKISIISGLLGLAWCFGIIVLYYVSHKPFNLERLITLFQRPAGWVIFFIFLAFPLLLPFLRQRGVRMVLGGSGLLLFMAGLVDNLGLPLPGLLQPMALSAFRVGVALLLVGLGGALGRLLTGELPFGRLANLSVQAALGLGIMAIAVLGLGAFSLLNGYILGIGLTGLLALLWKPLLFWARQTNELLEIWQEGQGFERWIAGLLLAIFLFSLLVSLAPPLQFDSLVYHLTMPQTYLNQGAVTYLPWLIWNGNPQTIEMLYTWAAALAGFPAAACLGWFCCVLAVLGLLGFLRERLGTRAAWVGVTALLSGFTLAVSPAWAYVDWMTLFLGVAALICLDGWRLEGSKKLLCLSALFAGMALATKYTAGILGLVVFAVVLWHVWKRKERLWPVFWCFALFAVLPVLPWLLRNFLDTGNPFYPLLFPAGAADAFRMAVHQKQLPWGNWMDLILLPLRATYLGMDSTDGYSASVGPLLLGLGALAFLLSRKIEKGRQVFLENAGIFSVLGCLIWALGNQFTGLMIQTRLYFCIFPAFAILAAAGYAGLVSCEIPGVRLTRLVNALVLLVLVLNFMECGLYTTEKDAAGVILGSKDEQWYLADNLGWYAEVMQEIKGLPIGSHTLLLYEPRSLYCLPDCEPDENLDRWQHSRALYGSTENILQTWKAEGFTHFLFYRVGANFLREAEDIHSTSEDWQTLDQFLGTLQVTRDYNGIYELYTLP